MSNEKGRFVPGKVIRRRGTEETVIQPKVVSQDPVTVDPVLTQPDTHPEPTESHVATPEEAAKVAQEIGLDFAQVPFDLDQFTRGMNVEFEHGARDPQTNVTNDDPIITGKIAWAHLKELPDYYDRLAQMEGEEE